LSGIFQVLFKSLDALPSSLALTAYQSAKPSLFLFFYLLFQTTSHWIVLSLPHFTAMAPPSSSSLVTSQGIALQSLDEALRDFGLSRKSDGSQIRFVGGIPALSSTKSEKINLSLIGAIPALANAVAATQIYEARGGEKQTIEIDLRRGHNYIDPDIGMTPSINGQVNLIPTLSIPQIYLVS
jgi:hypothetical protein